MLTLDNKYLKQINPYFSFSFKKINNLFSANRLGYNIQLKIFNLTYLQLYNN